MFDGIFQPMHVLLIFAIALLVFGPRNLPDLGKSLGESIREFKRAIAEDEKRSASDPKVPVKNDELKGLP